VGHTTTIISGTTAWEPLSRWVVIDEDIISKDLIGYPMIVESMLGAYGACGQCWCRLGSPAHCCMGRWCVSQEPLSRWVVVDEDIISKDLIGYPMIVESMLGAYGTCGQCWCWCRLGSPAHCGMGRWCVSQEPRSRWVDVDEDIISKDLIGNQMIV